MSRVLLIQMPFFSIYTPSIGLSMVKAAFEADGVACELLYANLDYAERIGPKIYQSVHEQVPQHLLLGDLVFTEVLNPARQIDAAEVAVLADRLVGRRMRRQEVLSNELLTAFRGLVEAAKAFCTDLVANTDWSRYDLIGLGTIFQAVPALALSRKIKEMVNGPPVILGGSQCEGEMGEALHRGFPWIDFVCRGEGEKLGPALIRALGGDGKLAEIHGLVWRDNGTTRCNGPATDGYAELDDLPVPTYSDWLELTAAKPWAGTHSLRLPLETSRGCWYGEKAHCTFCGLNGLNMTYRRKSPERALAEFDALRATGISSINAVDNILDHRYFKTFVSALAEREHGCTLFYEIKSNLNYEQMKLLRAAGIVWVQPGIESLNTHVLKQMRKGVTALQNLRVLKWAAELGIGVAWNLLYGLPGERLEDFSAQVELIPLIDHLPPPVFACNRVRLDRYSPLFDAVRAERPQELRPYPAYALAYSLPAEALAQLAYYFELEQPDPEPVEIWVVPLRAAVDAWHSVAGRSGFVSLARSDGIELFDSRAIASAPSARLNGLEARVYLAAEQGRSTREIAQSLQASDAEVGRLLAGFVERRWAAELDGRVLGLAVPLEPTVFADVPEALLGSTALAYYAARMQWQRAMLLSDTGQESSILDAKNTGGELAH